MKKVICIFLYSVAAAFGQGGISGHLKQADSVLAMHYGGMLTENYLFVPNFTGVMYGLAGNQNSQAATFANIVALFSTGGSCTGFLKFDGTCPNVSGAPGGSLYSVQYNGTPGGVFAGLSLGVDQILQGTTTTPRALTILNCNGSNSALIYSQSPTSAFGCNTIPGFANPMTTLGDLIIASTAGAAARLPGNTTTTPMVYESIGDGTAATTPLLNSLSGLLDASFGSNIGSIISRGTGGWYLMTPGANGDYLQTQGPGAQAIWSFPEPLSGASLPGTCSVGTVFFLTTAPAGQNWYGCTTINTWTLLGGTGTGNVSGPGSSTTNHLALWNGTSGTLLSDSGFAIPASATALSSDAAGHIVAATYQGNGAKTQLSTGTTTTNDCVKFDANGNTVDSGSACAAAGVTSFSGDTGNHFSTNSSSSGAVTLALATAAANSIWGNDTSSTAAPNYYSVSLYLDNALGSAEGTVAVRGASGWTGIGPSTSGYGLETQGSGNPVTWAAVVRPAQANTWTTGLQDMHAAQFMPPAGSSLPGTCSVNQVFFLTSGTSGQDWYGCTATNTWTLMSGGSGSSVNWARSYQTSSQSVPGSFTPTDLTFDTDDAQNTTGIHSTTTNPENFYAVANGYYAGSCTVNTATTGQTGLYGYVLANHSGTDTIVGQVGYAFTSTAAGIGMAVPWSAYMVIGDYIHCNIHSAVGFVSPGSGNTTQMSFFQIAAPGGGSGGAVNQVSGDGALITNSASAGNVTLTTGNAAAYSFWGNNTGSTAAAGFSTIQQGTNSVAGIVSCDGTTTSCVSGQVTVIGGGSGSSTQLTSFQTTQASNVLTVNASCSSTTPCPASMVGGGYSSQFTSSGTMTLSGSTSGTIYEYLDSSLNVVFASASGVTLTCTGGSQYVCSTTATTAFPAGSQPLYTWTNTGGTLTGTKVDLRGSQWNFNMTGSNGIVISQSSGTWNVSNSEAPLIATSGSIGGSALIAGGCSTGTVTVTGAANTMDVHATPVADPGTQFYWKAVISSANTVTVSVCATIAGTPSAEAYNVRVIP